MRKDLSGKTKRAVVWIYGLALLYFVLKQCYFAVFAGGFPDEAAQISYVIQMAKAPAAVPDFAAMRMWNAAGSDGGLTIMAESARDLNYLAHPPLYYLVMAAAGGVRTLPDGTAAVSVMRLRALNILMSAGAVSLAFSLGYRRLKGRSAAVHAVYAAAVATLPMLAYVGAGVNNDNLAFLALVIFFTGMARYDEGKTDVKTYALIGAGFLAGSFAKLTTALMCAIMMGAALVTNVVRTKSLKLILNKGILAVLPGMLLFLGYEMAIHGRYGSWQPSLLNIDEAYYYTTHFYVAPENRVPMTLAQYARHFLSGIRYTWGSLYGHNTAVTEAMDNGAWGLIYWIVPGAAAAALIGGWVRKAKDPVALPVVLAFIGTLAYHFYSNWKGYPVSGYLQGIQARYYLGMIVPLAYIACTRAPALPEKYRKIGRAAAVALIAGWIAGDAVRLVFIYGFPAGGALLPV